MWWWVHIDSKIIACNDFHSSLEPLFNEHVKFQCFPLQKIIILSCCFIKLCFKIFREISYTLKLPIMYFTNCNVSTD